MNRLILGDNLEVLNRWIGFTQTCRSFPIAIMKLYGAMRAKIRSFQDKKGEQTVRFKTGTHTIAVKVVNENGLEAIEILRCTL